MRYRLFQYPLPAPPELEDLNAYLQSQRVATVVQHLVHNPSGAMLVFVVETVEAGINSKSIVEKIDYREKLNDEEFAVRSYACRAGRGQHAALRQVRLWMRPGDWFFKADVARFYDNVDHDILRMMLARRFRERRLLDLFDRLLASYSKSPGKGLPIGALTSQYLGNFYLDPFDRWVAQSCHIHRYMRYMDDLLFLADHATLGSLPDKMDIVMDGLGLKIKNNGILNRTELGVPFLGFVLYPNRTRLNRLGRRRLRRKTRDMERRWESGQLSESLLQARGEALFAHARFGDDIAWRRAVTGFSRFRETQEPDPCSAGRLVEQQREQVPLCLSQQEHAG